MGTELEIHQGCSLKLCPHTSLRRHSLSDSGEARLLHMGPVVAPPGKRANCHFSFFHPTSGCHLVNSTGQGGLQIRSALSPWVTGQGMARGLAPQRPVCFFRAPGGGDGKGRRRFCSVVVVFARLQALPSPLTPWERRF